MEKKFTKGKWVKKSTDILVGKELISTAYHRNGYKRDMYGNYEKCEESEANALLISKAPEMFEMLKYFTDFPDSDFENFSYNDKFTMTVMVHKIAEAKQLLKEATEL